MAVLSWQLTILSLLVVPLFVYLTYRVGRIRRQLRKETQESLAEMSALTEETLSVSGVLLTKVFARTGDAVERYRRENQRLADLQVRQQMVGRTFFALVGTFFSFAPTLVYLVAGLAIYYGIGAPISAGTIVAFTALQTRLFFPIGSMLQVSTEIQSSLALFERIFQYLDLPNEIVDRPGVENLAKDDFRGQVSFRDVSSRTTARRAPTSTATSARRARWALEHVDFEVEPGQLAALVGASGAGKTTITYLIPRLYEATDGVVAIDGIDVKDIALGSLAEAVGMVTQETYLFHASVRENLLYARPDATDEEIERAARAALIHDRIAELEDGYDTRVGERGYRMSGGEKQRLAIARVLLKDPRILVLDEATSALDTTSERLVQRALEPLMAGRTTIAIAHRLSTIVAADVIFVSTAAGSWSAARTRTAGEARGLRDALRASSSRAGSWRRAARTGSCCAAASSWSSSGEGVRVPARRAPRARRRHRRPALGGGRLPRPARRARALDDLALLLAPGRPPGPELGPRLGRLRHRPRPRARRDRGRPAPALALRRDGGVRGRDAARLRRLVRHHDLARQRPAAPGDRPRPRRRASARRRLLLDRPQHRAGAGGCPPAPGAARLPDPQPAPRAAAVAQDAAATSRPVQLEQQLAELGEPILAELLGPARLHLADRLAHHAAHRGAAWRQREALRAQVVGIDPALEVAAALELAEQIVQRLLAHPQPGRELRGPRALGARVLEDGQVRGVEVVEAALVQPLEHAPLHGLPGHAEQRADQRRAEGFRRVGKAT